MEPAVDQQSRGYERITLRGYAKARGLNPRTVYGARDRGRITVGPDGLVDPVEADREMAANRHPNPNKGGHRPGAGGVPGKRRGRPSKHQPVSLPATVLTLEEAYRRKETALAIQAELKVEAAKGTLLDMARRVIAEEAARDRTHWEQFADRVYAGLAAKHGVTDPEGFRRDLEEAIHAHLGSLSEAP